MYIDIIHKYLVCPEDHHELTLYPIKTDGTDVLEGIFFCSNCKRWFPIYESIPHFYRDEDRNLSELHFLDKLKSDVPGFVHNYALPFNCSNPAFKSGSVLKPDMKYVEKKLQHDIDVYDWNLRSKYLNYIELHHYMDCFPNSNTLLEVGCGTGRVTKELAQYCDEIVALDFSFSKLLLLQSKITSKSKIHIIAGDASYLPFPSNSFDCLASFQTFEHILPQLRKKGYSEISRVLKRMSPFIVSVYNWSLFMRIFDTKVSYPNGEQHYWFNFTPAEFIRELIEHFEVKMLKGIRCIPARTFGDKLSTILGIKGLARIDGMLSDSYLGTILGRLLLAKCYKK